MVVALLTAAGVGSRMGLDIPKQFLHVNNKPLIIYTLEAFQNHPEIDSIAVVCVDGWEQMLRAYARQFNIDKLDIVVPGGENGQGSIRNGVYELEKHFDKDDIVLIHDAARAFVTDKVISRANTTREKPSCRRAVTPANEWTASCVLACNASFGKCFRIRAAIPKSCTINPSGCSSFSSASESIASDSSFSCTTVLNVT